jgi:uracil-DNA glycosylase
MPIKDRSEPPPIAQTDNSTITPMPLLGTNDMVAQAAALAATCATLEDLKQAIQDFEGLAVKKTATQIVFADGDPSAKIMVIGEAPGADEDRQGKPFVGASGQLLDKILACINLARAPEGGQRPVYISNILNWRPPGNRTPTDQEVQIALPFIQKHIELVNPDYLILSGGVAAKGLIGSSESISRLRGKFHDILIGGRKIPAIATYHPSYLLRTPSQKRAVWQDMLMLQERL